VLGTQDKGDARELDLDHDCPFAVGGLRPPTSVTKNAAGRPAARKIERKQLIFCVQARFEEAPR
jgi:hypothetical protein